jgi:recombination protein RecA
MPAAISELESLLRARKLDHTLAHLAPDPRLQASADVIRWAVPTGVPALDERLAGGLPRGQLSEIVGPRSSGRLALAVSAMAAATARGEAVALVDPLDMFDPVSASASGIDFQRVLWVRGDACGSSRVSLSCEYGTLQKAVDRGIKALNIILQAGGFGLVVIDLAEVASQAIGRLPYTTWLRLARVIEGSDTACLLLGSAAIAKSARGASVRLDGKDARVVRSQVTENERHVCVPLSAAAC